MLDAFKLWTLYLAVGIGLAALMATVRSVRLFFRRPFFEKPIEGIRLDLGRWLGLALEFELAADILRTAVAPTWDDIGKLAAIIVLRTALNYFLQREIAHSERVHRGLPG